MRNKKLFFCNNFSDVQNPRTNSVDTWPEQYKLAGCVSKVIINLKQSFNIAVIDVYLYHCKIGINPGIIQSLMKDFWTIFLVKA